MKGRLGRDKTAGRARISSAVWRQRPRRCTTSVDTDETKVWVRGPSVLWLRRQPDAYCSRMHRRQS
jgi:hypothetical protein